MMELLSCSLQFHCQTNPIPVHIDLKYFHANLLVQMYHFVRVFDVMVGHLADVDEAVLVHADVDKGTESGDVGHDAVEGHARTQILDFSDVLVKLECL